MGATVKLRITLCGRKRFHLRVEGIKLNMNWDIKLLGQSNISSNWSFENHHRKKSVKDWMIKTKIRVDTITGTNLQD